MSASGGNDGLAMIENEQRRYLLVCNIQRFEVSSERALLWYCVFAKAPDSLIFPGSLLNEE